MTFAKLTILFAGCILSATAAAQFGPGISVATNAHAVIELRAVDLNGDQHLDIVVQQPSAIAWLKNLGDGNFGGLDTIYVSQGELGPFDFADTQDNGGMDLVISDMEADTVLLLLNDGAGNFGVPIGLLGTESRVALNLANVMGSDLPDLVIHFDDGVYALENVTGNFGSAEFLGFGGPLVRSQYMCDIDDDDDLDIICFVGLSATINFLVNPGQSDDPWTVASGPYSFMGTNYFRLLDVDGDGGQDLAEVGGYIRWVAFDLDTVRVFGYGEAGLSTNYFRAGWAAQLGCGTGASMLWTDSIGEPAQWATYDPVLGDFGAVHELPDLPSFRLIRSADLDADGKEDLILWHDDSLLTWHRNSLADDTIPPPAPLDLGPFCPRLTPYTLPTPGTWSGPGVVDGVFTAIPAGLGTHELVRTIQHPSGCYSSTLEYITVGAPEIQAPVINPCDTGVFQFTATPIGGSWLPFDNGTFDTDAARPFNAFVVYTINDPAGETCAAGVPLVLQSFASAYIGPHGPYCESDTVQVFGASAGSMMGGVGIEDVDFLVVEPLGNGLTRITFDPAIGPGDYTFGTSAVAPMQCMGFDSFTIHVDPAIPDFVLSPFDTLCYSAVNFPLGQGPIPGSTWSGDGVANGLFTPVGPFMDTFTDVRLFYSAVAGACAAEVETSIAVGGPLIDTLSWVESLCGNAESVQFVAIPSGGTWEAPLDASGTLDPSTVLGSLPVGVNVTYTFTDNTGASCVDSLELITIEPVPDVSVTYDVLCSEGPVFVLTDEGTPEGGLYYINASDTSVTELDPALLTDPPYVLTYTYTDTSTGCSNSDTTTFTVQICTVGFEERSSSTLHVYPNPSKDGTVRITGQLPGSDLLLYDATGRVLWQRRAVGGNIPVEITGLATGMYRLVSKGVEGAQAIGVVVE